jgi:hypothetical protein
MHVYFGSGESVHPSFVNLVGLTVSMNRIPAMCTDRGSDEMNCVCAPSVFLEGMGRIWIVYDVDTTYPAGDNDRDHINASTGSIRSTRIATHIK